MNRDKNICKGLHIINLSQKNMIKIGRGHDVDVRINDISVSRFHAIIRIEKNNLYMEDNNSKFGTLILIRSSYPLNEYSDFSIQSGRSVLSFSLKLKKKSKASCFGYKHLEKLKFIIFIEVILVKVRLLNQKILCCHR